MVQVPGKIIPSPKIGLSAYIYSIPSQHTYHTVYRRFALIITELPEVTPSIMPGVMQEGQYLHPTAYVLSLDTNNFKLSPNLL